MIIASPNQLHAETGIECARRGIDILIEKPVTDTLETASALIAEVRKSGIKSLVGHHRRHHLQVKTLKALLGEGRIGDIVGVSAIWATHKPADYFKTAPWRTEAGGGPILINLIHEIDFLRFTIGEIVAVEAIAVEAPAWLCGRGYRRRADRIRQWRAGHIFRQRQRGHALDDGAGPRRGAGIPVQRTEQLPPDGPSRRNGVSRPRAMGAGKAMRRTGTSRSRPSTSMPPRSIPMSRSSIISAT